MMDKDKMELKTLMTAAEAAEYLTGLAKGLKSGRIVLEKGEERLELSPAPDLLAEVEVEARRKKDKARFSLEITWRMAEPLGETEVLRISAEASPAAKAPEKKVEAKKPDEKKPEPAKAEAAKPAPQAPAAAPAGAKSDVKPAAPAVNEPGGKGAVAAAAPAKPKP